MIGAKEKPQDSIVVSFFLLKQLYTSRIGLIHGLLSNFCPPFGTLNKECALHVTRGRELIAEQTTIIRSQGYLFMGGYVDFAMDLEIDQEKGAKQVLQINLL